MSSNRAVKTDVPEKTVKLIRNQVVKLEVRNALMEPLLTVISPHYLPHAPKTRKEQAQFKSELTEITNFNYGLFRTQASEEIQKASLSKDIATIVVDYLRSRYRK